MTSLVYRKNKTKKYELLLNLAAGFLNAGNMINMNPDINPDILLHTVFSNDQSLVINM